NTIEDRGLDNFREQVERRSGVKLDPPQPFSFTSTGDRYGWTEGRRSHLTLYIESGRVRDFAGGAQMLTGLRRIASLHDGDFRITPNQNLIIANVAEPKRAEIARIASDHGLLAPPLGLASQFNGVRRAPDLRIGACRE